MNVPCAQQTTAAHCQSTPIGVRHEVRPADSSRDDAAAFTTAPIVDVPAQVYNILRSIRVVLYEAIAAQLIKPSNGYSSIADLTGVMVTNYGSDMSIDEVSGVVTNFGSQYFDVCQLNGSLAFKDKAPLTVPCWFAFQTQIQLYTKLLIESAAHHQVVRPKPKLGQIARK